jgi:hypothetical protein
MRHRRITSDIRSDMTGRVRNKSRNTQAGSASEHLATREHLVDAPVRRMSERLHAAVFDTIGLTYRRSGEAIDLEQIVGRLAEFAMKNPELGRLWLFELLNGQLPAHDKFWHAYQSMMERFVASEDAQPGIDAEVHSILMLAGAFLWPVWVRAHARNEVEREEMTMRFTREIVRLNLHGTLRAERFGKPAG